MWKAIRYRRLQALALLALSALITTCAVVTPLYDRAMLQALTRAGLQAASVPATTVTIATQPGSDNERIARNGTPSLSQIAGVLPAAARPAFRAPIADISVLTVDLAPERRSTVGTVVWRAGECDHVVLVSGTCPAAAAQVLVSTADAANFGLHVGSVRSVREDTNENGVGSTLSVRVVGVYRLRPGDYWGSLEATGQSGLAVPLTIGQRFHDAWLTAEATFATAKATTYLRGLSRLWVDPRVSVDYVLDRPAYDADRALSVGDAVRRAQNAQRGQIGSPFDDPSILPVTITSQLPALAPVASCAPSHLIPLGSDG